MSAEHDDLVLPPNVGKEDMLEYFKAFYLTVDRDMDGIVKPSALCTFFKSIGEEVDEATAKQLIDYLQVNTGVQRKVGARMGKVVCCWLDDGTTNLYVVHGGIGPQAVFRR